MAEREVDPRLKELWDSGKTIYSISRLDSINNCLYGAYRTYILKDRGKNNIYAVLGGKIHDVLENIVNGNATEDDLLPAMQDELENAELMGLEFPKSEDGSSPIRDGWVKDMTHFCTTYKSPRKNLSTEELFIYKTSDGHYLQGYIDLQRLKPDSIDIYDYKTSTLYKGEDIKHHGRQLVVYQMGLEQDGKTVDNVAWIFLKYVDITFMGKKTAKSKEKTQITKTIERKKIAQEMSKYVEQDLFEMGIDEIDADIILTEFKTTNSFDCLPDAIKNNYQMKPCVYKYEVTDEVKQECEDYINNTIKMWESLGEDERNYPPRKFTKIQKNGKEVSDIFFCTNLCGHFDKCPHIHDYLDKLNNVVDNDEDIF